jgi:hypothetical protein
LGRERLVRVLGCADMGIEQQLRWNGSSPQSGSNLRELAFSRHPFYAEAMLTMDRAQTASNHGDDL